MLNEDDDDVFNDVSIVVSTVVLFNNFGIFVPPGS